METLTDLGLTLNQARIYIALLRSDVPLAVKDISKVTKISRQDIYRTLPMLQKDGLVEKTITSPTGYKAVPIKLGIAILINKKTAEQTELLERAKKLADSPEFNEKEHVEQEHEFILVPEKDAVVQKINRAMKKARKTIDIVTSKNRVERAMFKFLDARTHALQQGVKIRTIHEKKITTNAQVKEIMEIERKAGIQVRLVDIQPPALLTLIDDQEIVLITSPDADLEAAALWSNNVSLVAVAKTYFECLWQNATPRDDA
jgi:sugar-specific transcriptional regulator TrmB